VTGLGELLLGIGNIIFACIAVYNLIVSRSHAKAIEKLEVNTNSIKDALIKVTAESEHAKGVLQGKAEEAGALNARPAL
jgi:multisubunit Na+/H+ antiporter MnhC subunit